MALFLDIGRTLDWATVRHNALAVAWEIVLLRSRCSLASWRLRARCEALMARGFESKSVADQQESASRTPRPRGEPGSAGQAAQARAGARRRAAPHRGRAAATRYREMLQRALAAVDKELAALR